MIIAAIVVTCNRLGLLKRCLAALLAQDRRADRIVVVDNASTDGTGAWLASEGRGLDPSISLLSIPTNTGGSGGFHAGMRAAYDDGADWLWIMDDDTIASPTALSSLLAAQAAFPPALRPWLLASRVVWEDGRLHPMNLVAVKQRYHREYLWSAAHRGCLSIRSATFVSLLIDRRCVRHYGLPLADYFIWNDDVEYTARILRHQPGIAVPTSLVLHATRTPYGTHDAEPARYFYFLRNQAWMLLWSASHDRPEKLLIAQMWLLNSTLYLLRRRLHPKALWHYARAAWHIVSRRPSRRNEPEQAPVAAFVDGPVEPPHV
jgi:rhamnopyranosyl-N-acetylglucosaminyl-diphospho-decaprenol beta-1,3/1,4-galactofuranosyltransferase